MNWGDEGDEDIKSNSTAELVNSEEDLRFAELGLSALRIRIRASSSNIIDELGGNKQVQQ